MKIPVLLAGGLCLLLAGMSAFHTRSVSGRNEADFRAIDEYVTARMRSGRMPGLALAIVKGDQLVAAHFGIRSRRVLHWWFPAYDPELGKYSPGAQLLLELAREAAARGVERIDLGEGDESYKLSFMTGATALAVGSVDTRPAARAARKLWHHTKRWVRESPFRGTATVPWRFIRNMRDKVQFR